MNTATNTRTDSLDQAVDHLTQTIHDLLWNELKDKIIAIRETMRHLNLLYTMSGPDNPVPEDLMWARIAGYSGSRFSLERGTWYVTRHLPQYNVFGPRIRIPSEFIEATPRQCRQITRRLVAERTGDQ